MKNHVISKKKKKKKKLSANASWIYLQVDHSKWQRTNTENLEKTEELPEEPEEGGESVMGRGEIIDAVRGFM